jgi:hypothetical protein
VFSGVDPGQPCADTSQIRIGLKQARLQAPKAANYSPVHAARKQGTAGEDNELRMNSENTMVAHHECLEIAG